jgi:hypothetical protein
MQHLYVVLALFWLLKKDYLLDLFRQKNLKTHYKFKYQI